MKKLQAELSKVFKHDKAADQNEMMKDVKEGGSLTDFLEKGWGDCRGHAIVLQLMLQGANLNSRYTYIKTKDSGDHALILNYDQKKKNMHFLDHYWDEAFHDQKVESYKAIRQEYECKEPEKTDTDQDIRATCSQRRKRRASPKRASLLHFQTFPNRTKCKS